MRCVIYAIFLFVVGLPGNASQGPSYAYHDGGLLVLGCAYLGCVFVMEPALAVFARLSHIEAAAPISYIYT
jgi:hypothetical protein